MRDINLLKDVHNRILRGELSLRDGAHRLGVSEEAMAALLRDLALGRGAGLPERAHRRVARAVAGRVRRLGERLASAPGVADLRQRLGRAVATFAIASVGVIMLSGAASVHPAGTRADEGPDVVRQRFASNVSYTSADSVNRQLERAGSVYARVGAVLAARGEGNESLKRALERRRRALEGVKLDYIKHGRDVPVNAALRFRAGAIYDRLIETFPAPELREAKGLAAELLERARHSDEKLASVRSYYVETLRRRGAPAAPQAAVTTASTAEPPVAAVPPPATPRAATATAAAVDPAVVPGADLAADAKEPWSEERFRARIADLLEEMKTNRQALFASRSHFRKDSRLPVISRFHRRKQIERAVEQAVLPELQAPAMLAM